MPAWKMTMGFRVDELKGSESYILLDASESDMPQKVQDLIDARNMMHSMSTRWVNVRIGILDQPRAAQSYIPGEYTLAKDGIKLSVPKLGKIAYDKDTQYPDQPKSALEIKVRYGDNRMTTRYLFGIPDQLLGGAFEGIEFTKCPAFATGYAAIRLLLESGAWGIRARAYTGAFISRKIAKWSTQAGEVSNMGAQVASGVPIPIAEGERVQIKGTRRKGTDKLSYNGQYIVAATIASSNPTGYTIYLDGTEEGDPASIKLKGTIQKVDWAPAAIKKWTWYRATTHKRGVSYGAPRGRHSKRVSLDP